MIELVFYGEDYEQDVRPLLKAFYPEEQFVVKKYLEIEEHEGSLLETCEKEYSFCIHFILYKKRFRLIYLDQNKKIKSEEELKEEVLAGQERSYYRNQLHRSLYLILEEVSGRRLPWGTLTGIRPVKQVLDRLEQDESEQDIAAYMKQEYFCSDEKLELCLKVAKREQELLNKMNYKAGYSIYIGIPFCPSTCAYCSFTSYPLQRYGKLTGRYLEALKKEIDYAAGCFQGKELQTVYIGGGTPTALSAEELDDLLHYVRNTFDFLGVREFTVEAGRPDSITESKLEVIKRWGADRISINPQSMRQETLQTIGRRHTVEEIEEAFHLARKLGHQNINMDIILGLPGETPADVAYTLERIKALKPDGLTVHTLALKRAARLTTEREQFSSCPAQNVAGMFLESEKFAKKNGYEPYYLYRQKNMAENLENIGYAKPGSEGIYNILIMEEKQTILALGAGGSSKFVFCEDGRIERVENVKSLEDYILRIDEMILRKKEFIAEYSDKL